MGGKTPAAAAAAGAAAGSAAAISHVARCGHRKPGHGHGPRSRGRPRTESPLSTTTIGGVGFQPAHGPLNFGMAAAPASTMPAAPCVMRRPGGTRSAAASIGARSAPHSEQGTFRLAGSLKVTWVEKHRRQRRRQEQRQGQRQQAAAGPGAVTGNRARTRSPVTGSATDRVASEHHHHWWRGLPARGWTTQLRDGGSTGGHDARRTMCDAETWRHPVSGSLHRSEERATLRAGDLPGGQMAPESHQAARADPIASLPPSPAPRGLRSPWQGRWPRPLV
jgi:hypothetical protein